MLSERAKEALDFALIKHAGQVDKADRPYLGHVLRVALEVLPLGEEYFIVGLLHDILEDTDVTKEEIKSRWGDDIADAVESVTRRITPTKEPYSELIIRSAQNKIGRMVKLADNKDNSDPARIANLPPDQQGITKRYAKARRVLEGFSEEHV